MYQQYELIKFHLSHILINQSGVEDTNPITIEVTRYNWRQKKVPWKNTIPLGTLRNKLFQEEKQTFSYN